MCRGGRRERQALDDTSTKCDNMQEWMDLVMRRIEATEVLEETIPIERKLSYKAWSKLSKAEQVALARQKVRGCG